MDSADSKGFHIKCKDPICQYDYKSRLKALTVKTNWIGKENRPDTSCYSENKIMSDEDANIALAHLRAWSAAVYLKNLADLKEKQIDIIEKNRRIREWSAQCKWTEEGEEIIEKHVIGEIEKEKKKFLKRMLFI